MNRMLAIGGVAAALLLSSAGAAQPPQRAPQGDLTRAQAEQMATEQLGRLDSNHDGVITKDELEKLIDRMATAGVPPEAAERLRGLMTRFGKDGRIVIADVVKARLEMFDKYDTNHDGKLDQQEREAARAAESGQAPR
jgi:Ca2+-binding EF-hand superfamily protein